MYASRITSSREERVIRMNTAATAVPSARLGSAMIARFPTGSTQKLTKSTRGAQPNQSEAARISIVACQKTGIDRLNRLATRTP